MSGGRTIVSRGGVKTKAGGARAKIGARGRTARRVSNAYDATKDSHRRKAPTSVLKAEDAVLCKAGRKKLTAGARDLRRNFPDAAWAIRKHLDFVSTFSFQARTSDTGLNSDIEAFVEWRSLPENCDLAARHPLHRMRRLAEAHAVIDGDVHWLKLVDGRCQAIEGERVRLPETGQLPFGYKAEDFTHGIVTSRGGRALEYCVCRRDAKGAGFVFDRIFPAKWMLSHGYYDRYDQVRGVTPLSSALNAFRDLYESRAYALAKAKVAQLFGLVITRKGGDQLGNFNPEKTTAEQEEERDYSKEINFDLGPQLLDMDPDAEAKFLENKTPSVEFQQFDQIILASALKSLDLPFSFYNESFTNFFGSRGALQQYIYSANIKRANLAHFMDSWTAWQLGLAIAQEVIRLPGRMAFGDLNWQWVPAGLPWWKPSEEVKACSDGVKGGFTSTPRVCLANGEDAYEILDEETKYQIARAKSAKQVHDAGGRMPEEDPPPPLDPNTAESDAMAKELKGEKANV